MENKINIFNSAKPIVVEWFYFKEPGDNIQGTYVKKIKGLKDSFGNEQIIYELKTDTGIKKVGFRVSQRINKTMDYIKFGQIVGLKYTGKEKYMNKKLGKEQEIKNIQVFADPKIVDQEWIDTFGKDNNSVVATEKDIPVVSSDEPEITPDEVPGFGDEDDGTDGFGDFDNIPKEETTKEAETPKATEKTPVELLIEIGDLAKKKLGVIDPTKVKDAVMAATGLAFITSNYSKIIKLLEVM